MEFREDLKTFMKSTNAREVHLNFIQDSKKMFLPYIKLRLL